MNLFGLIISFLAKVFISVCYLNTELQPDQIRLKFVVDKKWLTFPCRQQPMAYTS
jgi:hypothetical protein